MASAPEKWAEIPGFPGYEASSEGRVRSWRGPVGTRLASPVIRAQQTSRVGYRTVGMVNESGKTKSVTVHRAVLMAFAGGGDGLVCRHLDGTRTNNKLSNLAWGSYRENYADSVNHGTAPFGERCGSAKLTAQDVAKVFDLYESGMSQPTIAAKMGVSRRTVRRILRAEQWSTVAHSRAESLSYRQTTRRADTLLSAHDVIEIRRLRASGVSGSALASRYGVSREYICGIVKGRVWKDVPMPNLAESVAALKGGGDE